MDDGQPPKSVNATVTVNVIRNIPVVITNPNTAINIDPNSVQGKQLLTINASDQDKKVNGLINNSVMFVYCIKSICKIFLQ